MPRTHLFTSLQRSMRMAAALEREHISTSEGLERREAAQWSRRQFLKASAGATVAGAVGISTLGDTQRLMRRYAGDPQIVIVGAGAAGLTTAYRLHQAGLKPRLLESNTLVGGRMKTLRGKFPAGQIAEFGGEFIDTGHEAMHTLAKELNIPLVNLLEHDGKLPTEVYFFDGKFISEDQLIEDFRPVAKAIDADLATLTGDDITYDAPNGAEHIDQQSIDQWLTANKVTGTMRKILEAAYVGEYGLEIAEQSALNLLWLITTEPDTFKVFGDSDEAFHIKGGNDTLTTALAAKLGNKPEFGTVLEAIRPRGSDGYTISVKQGSKSTDIDADVLILALPFSMLRKVDLDKLDLPDVKKLAIKTLGYGTNSKVITGFNERIWNAQNSNGYTFTDLPFQNAWETVREQPGKNGVITNYLGGKDGVAVLNKPIKQAAEEFVQGFDKVYPGAAKLYNGAAEFADWPKQPWVQASYACYLPGQYTTIRGAEGEAVGKLFFCGEHTSLDSQGYMDGAVESGERVAKEVLTALGVKS
jgi:monoamine oxidase